MKKLCVAALTALFLVAFLTSCGITNFLFRDMSNLPEGEFISSHDSPSKVYTVNIYLCGGGATTDFSIRGELVCNDDESVKNIYWSYHEREAEVDWIDDETVTINAKTLNILDDVYDFRKQ